MSTEVVEQVLCLCEEKTCCCEKECCKSCCGTNECCATGKCKEENGCCTTGLCHLDALKKAGKVRCDTNDCVRCLEAK